MWPEIVDKKNKSRGDHKARRWCRTGRRRRIRTFLSFIFYVSKYEKRHLPLEADDALSGLESLNGSGGLDVLGSGGNLPTIIPGLVIVWGGACRALLWTCDLFHFINCGLQSRTTFWTEAISQAIADLCVWLFDLFYCLSNCGALSIWQKDLF